MTEQEIKHAIEAAFDSVQLINFIDAMPTPLSEEDRETRRRNVEHLWVMSSKEWFVQALTTEQKEIFNEILS